MEPLEEPPSQITVINVPPEAIAALAVSVIVNKSTEIILCFGAERCPKRNKILVIW